MFYDAQEGHVIVNGSTMNYVVFGKGSMPLIILPGLSDGLRTVRGLSKTMALSYRLFARDYRVYMFSRKNELEDSCTTRDMARDQKLALEQLGLKRVHMMGISQGGMIAQHFAINHPDTVEKLVLGVSASRPNTLLQDSVNRWIHFAEDNNYKALILDTMERTYSDKTLKKYKLAAPLISRIGKPKNFRRFLIQSRACLAHNTYDELEKIQCPTLIIGGDSDQIVGPEASPEMAEKINKSRLIIYEGLGHGAYEESKDFNELVINFLATANNSRNQG